MFNLIGTYTLTPFGINSDRELFESTLEAALSSGDVPELMYADFIVTAISTVVDKAIPRSKSGHPESQPVSEDHLR